MSIIFLTYAHLNFITANILLFFKIKFPHTAVRTFRTIREAAQATAFDARVNRSSKTAVFVNTDRFARMIRHTLAAARRLHTAVAVAVNKPVAFTNAFMLVQIAVKAIVQRLLQALKSYPLKTRERITFEYLLLGGVNDGLEQARQLARVVSDVKGKLNLIVYNPSEGDPY